MICGRKPAHKWSDYKNTAYSLCIKTLRSTLIDQ